VDELRQAAPVVVAMIAAARVCYCWLRDKIKGKP